MVIIILNDSRLRLLKSSLAVASRRGLCSDSGHNTELELERSPRFVVDTPPVVVDNCHCGLLIVADRARPTHSFSAACLAVRLVPVSLSAVNTVNTL